MVEIRKAKVNSSSIEKGYIFRIDLGIFREDIDEEQYLQGFYGNKLHNDNDYNIWRNAVENVLGRRVEDGKGAIIKTVIDDEDILGIGNFKENYWIVQEKVKDKDGRTSRTFSIKQNTADIKEKIKKNGLEYEKTKDEGKEDVLR